MESDLSASKRALLEQLLQNPAATSRLRSVTRAAEDAAGKAGGRVPIVAIHREGTKRPLFYLHVHWQGGAFYCFKLARMLGDDQPFYVLDLYRFEDLEHPPTIEAMAADYITAMRTIQPSGPYQIAAFCGASVLAYEMARQLRRAEQPVAFVGFIDPMAGAIRSIRLTRTLIDAVGGLLRMSQGTRLDWFLRIRYWSRVIRQARDEYTEQADQLMRRWNAEHPARFPLLPAAGALRQDWLAVLIWAIAGFKPDHYPGVMTYLFARDNPDSRRLWWGKVRQDDTKVEIRTIPGDHVTCRTEHLAELAAALHQLTRQSEPSAAMAPM